MRCMLTLTTSADGSESKTERSAELIISPESTELRYREEAGASVLRFFYDHAEIVRTGDYGLRLFLRAGETTAGELLLGNASGEIQTFTHKIASRTENGRFFALLQYDLIIAGEKQKMRVRLQTKTMKLGEENAD